VSTDLAVPQDKQAEILKYLGLSPTDIRTHALLLAANKYGLDPLLQHIFLVEGKVYVSHKGLLHAAHRSGLFDGIEVLERSENDKEYYCKVAVYRKDFGRPVVGEGWHSKAIKHKDPRSMARVRAERQALVRAFDVSLDEGELDDLNAKLPESRPQLPVAAPVPALGRAPVGELSGPPAPPLPANPAPSVDYETGEILPEPDEDSIKRARALARACREAGMDDDLRGEFVKIITMDRTSSGKELTKEEWHKAMELATAVKNGSKTLDFNEEGQLWLR